MAPHYVPCAVCARDFVATRSDAQTCSSTCRNRRNRALLLAQRRRLAGRAEAALRTGDVTELTLVARATADMLAA